MCVYVCVCRVCVTSACCERGAGQSQSGANEPTLYHVFRALLSSQCWALRRRAARCRRERERERETLVAVVGTDPEPCCIPGGPGHVRACVSALRMVLCLWAAHVLVFVGSHARAFRGGESLVPHTRARSRALSLSLAGALSTLSLSLLSLSTLSLSLSLSLSLARARALSPSLTQHTRRQDRWADEQREHSWRGRVLGQLSFP